MSVFLKKNKLEKEIALIIAKVMKEMFGKGPTNLKSYLMDDLFVLKIRGFLYAAEILLAKTEHGRSKVKDYKLELVKAISSEIAVSIKKLLGMEPSNLYVDINPATDEGVIILTFSENLLICNDWPGGEE